MNKPLVSAFSYLLGYFAVGTAFSAFDVYIAEHYDHLMLAQRATFEFSVLAALLSDALSAALFVWFSSLLRATCGFFLSALLGALGYSLFIGICTLARPVPIPSLKLIFVLLAVPSIAACLARAVVSRMLSPPNAG